MRQNFIFEIKIFTKKLLESSDEYRIDNICGAFGDFCFAHRVLLSRLS